MRFKGVKKNIKYSVGNYCKNTAIIINEYCNEKHIKKKKTQNLTRLNFYFLPSQNKIT
jgi:hypothetical protein